MGVLMAGVAACVIAWRTSSTWATCILAATLVVTQYGSDQWRDKYLNRDVHVKKGVPL